MSKATPGPWKVRNWREVFKGTRRICSVNAGESLPLGEELDRAASNARLIAAAPELLDALEDLLECPYHIDEATVSKAGLEATMNANQYQVVGNMSVALFRVRKARAAIAKATGEQE